MTPTETPTPVATAAHRPRAATPVLIRAGLVLALIAASGVVRALHAGRIEANMLGGRRPGFPLREVPMQIGPWKGEETTLDEDIVKGTGSTDLITRRYVDQATGVSLDVIVLYGPTSDIFIHSPELCYPKAGYASHGDAAIERQVPLGDGRSAPVRSLAYAKGDPGRLEIQEVFYSWRYNGRWSTSVSSPKDAERIPGMYKVQVSRRILPKESRSIDNPCESFLGVLMPDLEARIEAQANRAGAKG